MSSVEIKVDEKVIREVVDDIDTMKSLIQSVQISTRVSESKGQTANSLNNLIDNIHTFRDELILLIDKNRVSVEDIANKFTQTDNELSSKYHETSGSPKSDWSDNK